MVVSGVGWVEFSDDNATRIGVNHLVSRLHWDWFLIVCGWFRGVLVVFPVPPAVKGVDEKDGVEDGDEGDVFMPVEPDGDDVEDDP